MAPRRGAEIEQEGEEEETRLTSLAFSQPLSWRAGKPIPTSELLKRLDSLQLELRELGEDQEEVDKDSLIKVAKELAGQHLLGHKDKGVRAFTACCLVDVLKICAPDAPFTPTQLKDIFTLFITSILPALSDPSHAYNTQHKYVLVSLAEVKSVVLLCDIPGSDPLILHLFSSFFDIMSGSSSTSTGEQIPKDVEYHMTQILFLVVDEAQSLPAGVVDIIVAQFLRASAPGGAAKGTGKNKPGPDENQSTLLLKELPAAYNMAKTICNSCPERMARYVIQYFKEVVMDFSSVQPRPHGYQEGSDVAMESDEDTAPVGPTDADMRELQKAHNLLRELWRASPPVLRHVIPQLEHEMTTENTRLRLLATETLGDIISGIGAAGPPPAPVMDPAAYPPATLEGIAPRISDSILTTPLSPHAFSQTHPSVYQSFLSRKNDKSPIVRSGWATAVGRILVTSAGGIGLSSSEEIEYVKGLAENLNDSDEKVRLAAVKAIGGFSFRNIMSKLAPNGGISSSGSVLGSLADRARDRKHVVRAEAMRILSCIWGVAHGEILSGNERVIEALGAIPTRVFDVYYANDPELNVLLDHATFEQLIPLTYPPSKPKSSRGLKSTKGDLHYNETGPYDVEKIRTERILLLVNSLNSKSRKAFFAIQARQPVFANVLELFLLRCEEFNGGLAELDVNEVKKKLDLAIKWFASLLPDPLRVNHDLHKFAKLHNRRIYHLLRCAKDPSSDFTTVHNAIKEINKKIQDTPAAPAGLLETLTPIIYRSACLVYNRSNQPVFSQYARTGDHGFGMVANLIMKEISDKHPEIFQASLKELCKLVQENAPSENKPNDFASVETLKSLASFAKSGQNKIPRDRKFVQALINFALYGCPPKAAKYAVSILAASSDRKEMHMKDLLDKSLGDWEYGKDHFLTKLATINQLTLLAPAITEEADDEILEISRQLLLHVRTDKHDEDSTASLDECQAKCLAIKILVARLRTAVDDEETAKTLAAPVYKLLNAIIAKEGEISKVANTPMQHKARLRLLAAQQMLKLCTEEMFDKLLAPHDFINLALVAQDVLEDTRRGFVEKLQKYLVKGLLPNRFLTIIFLTAFEPSETFRNSIMTWIRSRVKVAHDNKRGTFETIFPCLIHLLAHHPDYGAAPDDLRDHAKYILYYISTVASEDNLPLIYKYAQRVKQAKDRLSGAESDRLYVLSDLAQALIRKWEEKKGWSMQSWPKQVGLPVGLFAGLLSHEDALKIAETIYIPDKMEQLLDGLIREFDRKKQKRKIEDSTNSHSAKKIKSKKHTSVTKKSRPVKEKKIPRHQLNAPPDSTDRRRSGRAASAKKVYEERDSDEDDQEMWDGVASWEYLDGAALSSDDDKKHDDDDDEDDEDESIVMPPDDSDVKVDAEPNPKAEARSQPKISPETTLEEADTEQELTEESKEATPAISNSNAPSRSTRSTRSKAASTTTAIPAPAAAKSTRATQAAAKSSLSHKTSPTHSKSSPVTLRENNSKGKAPIAQGKKPISATSTPVTRRGRWKGKGKVKEVESDLEND